MKDQTRQLLDQGNAAFARRDYATAETCFTQVLKTHRRFPDLYGKLGAIYHQKGRFTDAIKLFAEALKLNPDYLEARVNLLVLLNDLGYYQHAEKLLSKLNGMAANPGALNMGRLATRHMECGDLYYSLHLYEHARVEYEHACKLRPGWPDLRLKLGVVYRRLRREADALRELETAVALNPKYLEGRAELGLTYYQAGKVDHAKSLWKGVLAQDPQHGRTQRYLSLAGAPPMTATAATAAMGAA
ncbi:MAG TPA: tetratricopeptide repeat protein [bacterium]|nr:tetratricopeptide repeat protein [bacterium]